MQYRRTAYYAGVKMSAKNILPYIYMRLDDTDPQELENFLLNARTGREITKEYLVLYNFAVDCKYAKEIQLEYIQCLMPFYLEVIKQAVTGRNKIAMDIYFEFNQAVFFNSKSFIYAVGERYYRRLMEYYIGETIEKMEFEDCVPLGWVSLFNTTAAFCSKNLLQLFEKIFDGSAKIKISFFQYLSVFLFKESDNLLIVNMSEAFWTSRIWDFDDGYFTHSFYWSKDTIEFFDREINEKRIKSLFQQTKPWICDFLGVELTELFKEEIEQSFVRGIFHNRKAEFLEKISSNTREKLYWDKTF